MGAAVPAGTASSALDVIPSLRERRWGTVVQVGAGIGSIDLPARRLVLLDGEPAVCAQLRAATRGRSGVEVHEQVIAAEAGMVTWHVHSWPVLSGLHDLASTLHSVYPRLQVLQRREVESRSLAQLLDELAPEREAGEENLLVIDLPAGAEALLASLPPARLLGFDWIVAGGWRQPPSAELPSWLQPQTWPCPAEPWARRLWRVDAAAYETAEALSRARAELAATSSQLQEADAQRTDLAQRVAEQASELAARRAEIDGLSTRLQALARAEGKLALIADLLLAERLK